jgi:hypothetical protein
VRNIVLSTCPFRRSWPGQKRFLNRMQSGCKKQPLFFYSFYVVL